MRVLVKGATLTRIFAKIASAEDRGEVRSYVSPITGGNCYEVNGVTFAVLAEEAMLLEGSKDWLLSGPPALRDEGAFAFLEGELEVLDLTP